MLIFEGLARVPLRVTSELEDFKGAIWKVMNWLAEELYIIGNGLLQEMPLKKSLYFIVQWISSFSK